MLNAYLGAIGRQLHATGAVSQDPAAGDFEKSGRLELAGTDETKRTIGQR